MNYTLLFAIVVCMAGMLFLTKSGIKDLDDWNGEFEAKTEHKNYKLALQQKNEKEIEFTLEAGGERKLKNAVATLVGDDMAIYDDGKGFTLIMKMENGHLAVTHELGGPYDWFERIAA